MTNHDTPQPFTDTHPHKTKRLFVGPLCPEGTPTIEVWNDGKKLRCKEFGVVEGWHTLQQTSHPVGNSRNCAHRLDPMPALQLFGSDWLRELHWQPTLIAWTPVIASRADGVVMLAFDVMGPVKDCHNRPHRDTRRIPDENRWYYKLYPIRWRDQPDAPVDHILLGVLQS